MTFLYSYRKRFGCILHNRPTFSGRPGGKCPGQMHPAQGGGDLMHAHTHPSPLAGAGIPLGVLCGTPRSVPWFLQWLEELFPLTIRGARLGAPPGAQQTPASSQRCSGWRKPTPKLQQYQFPPTNRGAKWPGTDGCVCVCVWQTGSATPSPRHGSAYFI